MKERLIACLSVFAVMALSNAIVPVLPLYAAGTALQGAMYSAYFLGAFALTLPAGLMSDRFGRVAVMRSGLLITIVSGACLAAFTDPLMITGARFFEGLGAGLFVAASMAYVNSMPDHRKMSGYFMASLNTGLVLGLIVSGVLATHSPDPSGGFVLFTGICLLSGVLSISLTERPPATESNQAIPLLKALVYDYRWLFYSSIVLIGVTGVVISLYPGFSGAAPDTAGLWIAGMSVATIVAALAISRMNLPPVASIRVAALFMAAGIILVFYSPAGFLVIGALAGVTMIAQMAILAQISDRQGAAMGLYSTTSYLGMSLLPFMAGIIAERATFFLAFILTACAAASVAVTIGKCACGGQDTP